MQIYLFLQKAHVFSFSDLLKMFSKLFCIFNILLETPQLVLVCPPEDVIITGMNVGWSRKTALTLTHC